MLTTAAQRAHHVTRMRASFAIEGMNPDPVDAALQSRYIDGSISLADMLAYATTFATRTQRALQPAHL